MSPARCPWSRPCPSSCPARAAPRGVGSARPACERPARRPSAPPAPARDRRPPPSDPRSFGRLGGWQIHGSPVCAVNVPERTVGEARARRESSDRHAWLLWDAVVTREEYKEASLDAAPAEHPDAGRTWRTPAAVTPGTASGGRGTLAPGDRLGARPRPPPRARPGLRAGRRAARLRALACPARGRAGRELGRRLVRPHRRGSARVPGRERRGVVLAPISPAARRGPGAGPAAAGQADRRTFRAAQQRRAHAGGPARGVDGAALPLARAGRGVRQEAGPFPGPAGLVAAGTFRGAPGLCAGLGDRGLVRAAARLARNAAPVGR